MVVMKAFPVEHFLSLEREIWSALLTGDHHADARLLSDDFLGVYPTGFARKKDHLEQLRNGPVVSEFDLSDPRTVKLSDEVYLLSYRADWVPCGDNPAKRCSMFVSSIWRNFGGQWKNVFSQDTSAETGCAVIDDEQRCEGD